MKAIALIAISVIVAAACAGLASAQTPMDTKVMVNENGKTPLIWIDQEPIIVRGNNVTITWRIATKGYVFPADGIAFHDPQFKCEGKGQVFRCVDANKTPGSFKYRIKVIRTGASGLSPELDPTVMND